jgi:SAM-dependent methyltransferase
MSGTDDRFLSSVMLPEPSPAARQVTEARQTTKNDGLSHCISATAGYALWARTWDATPSPVVALEHRVLLPRIERFHARRVIDVGCGTGRWASPLAAIGVDISPAMLAIAADKPGLRGRLAAADATALPIRTAAADLVLCTLTLGHVRSPLAALHELSRILEPGGSLILTDFHPAAAAAGWRRTFRSDGQVYEIENHPYTLEELRAGAVGLVLREWAEATIGEPERELFERAGRTELFEAASRTPAVLLTQWSRL